MTKIQHFAVNSLPPTADLVVGGIYFLNDGSQYIINSNKAPIAISDVLFVNTLPTVGTLNKIYILTENNVSRMLIWQGLEYIEIGGGEEFDSTELESAISALNSKMSTVEGQIIAIDAKDNEQDTEINNIKSNVTVLGGKVTNTESDIESINDDLDNIDVEIVELKGQIETHSNKTVLDDNGVHGFKITKNRLLYKENDEWNEFDVASATLPLIKNFKGQSSSDGSKVTVDWINPTGDEFIRTEIYVSTQDISNIDIADLSSVSTKVVTDSSTQEYVHNSIYGETYYFKVVSVFTFMDEEKYNNPLTLTVQALDSVPPSNVINIKAIPANNKFTLSWTNPIEPDFDKVKILMKEGSYPTSTTDGIVIYEGSGTSASITDNVVNNAEYFIRFFVRDTVGNVNSSPDMQVSVIPYKLQDVSNITIAPNLSGTEFILNWTNPSAVTFVGVEVYVSSSDLSLKTREQCIADGQLVTDDNVNTAKCTTTPNNTYYFKIFSSHDINSTITFSDGVSINKKAEDKQSPSIVTNVEIKSVDGGLVVKWTNPIDTDLGTVRLHYSEQDDISTINDGIVAYNGTGTSATITGLINNLEYHLRFFTIDNSGNINSELSMKYNGTPSVGAPSFYSIKIDTTNPNTSTSVTYIEEISYYVPAKMNFETNTFDYGSWQDKFPFNQIKPCVLKNGNVNYYLNPNDYTKKLDGTNADITSGNDGDVMVEFPKIYWKFERVGTDLYIRYSDTQVDSGYKCLAHMRGNEELNKTYIATFLGFEENEKIRSLSGKTPTGNKIIGAFRTLAQANGDGYEQITYYQLLMLQVLYLVMFKDRSSQFALGLGQVSSDNFVQTGGTNTKGLFYGENTGKQQMKFCGIEDFYGNYLYWIDGISTNSNFEIFIGNDGFNNLNTGYSNYGSITPSILIGYISDVHGGTESGFITKKALGTSSTDYADSASVYASAVPIYGGNKTAGGSAGAFALIFDQSTSSTNANIASRLSFY